MVEPMPDDFLPKFRALVRAYEQETDKLRKRPDIVTSLQRILAEGLERRLGAADSDVNPLEDAIKELVALRSYREEMESEPRGNYYA